MKLPTWVQETLEQDEEIRETARHYMEARNFLYLGRGLHFPIALEGALKLKEISYIHAEGYAAGEMKHGPIALIDREMPVVVLATRSPVLEKIQGNIEEVAARGGRHHRPDRGGQLPGPGAGGERHHRAQRAPGTFTHRPGDAAADAGLPYRRSPRHRRGPAPQPGQERDGGVEKIWGRGQGAFSSECALVLSTVNYFSTKAKRGRRMDSCWQMGQRDGMVRRSRFLKAKPQFLQTGGYLKMPSRPRGPGEVGQVVQDLFFRQRQALGEFQAGERLPPPAVL